MATVIGIENENTIFCSSSSGSSTSKNAIFEITGMYQKNKINHEWYLKALKSLANLANQIFLQDFSITNKYHKIAFLCIRFVYKFNAIMTGYIAILVVYSWTCYFIY